MKTNEESGFSGSRRRLLGGTAAAVALTTIPVGRLKAGTNAASRRPSLWLAWHDSEHKRWRPVASACRDDVVDRPLRVIVRGPRVVSGAPNPDLSLEAVYRRLPHQPFQLVSGLRPVGQGGVVLHADPGALAAVQIRQGTNSARCELPGLFSSVISPGRYAVVIDTDGNRSAPDWRHLGTSEDGFPFDAAGRRHLAAVLLDIGVA